MPSKTFEVENKKRFFIVSNDLPLIAYRDESSKEWCFDWDEDSLVLQLKDGLSTDVEVVYVGSLKAEIDSMEQDEVAKLLLDKFRCVPTFLPLDLINNFYHGFCMHFLRNLFHNKLPLTIEVGVRFNKTMWGAYIQANQIFADKIMGLINENEDYVWIHDYHLMVLPTILRKQFHRIKLGFFLHNPFPSSEIFNTLPMREEILKGLLNCDLVGFHTFDYARHFLSCCSRILGVDYKSNRGNIELNYHGRNVSVKILHVGINISQLNAIMSLPATADKVRGLRNKYDGKIVLLGADDVDMFKGISLKFEAMGKFLDKHHDCVGKVVLIQIMNPSRSRGHDIEEVENDIRVVADEVNRRYGTAGYMPIVCIHGPVSTQDKIAYYAISEGVVVNSLRDGMNLIAYKYTVARQGFPIIDISLGTERSMVSRSVIVVSEFMGCSRSLCNAIRVNPWDIESITEGITKIVNMSNEDKTSSHEIHYKYVATHDVTYWARSFCQDLERACSENCFKRYREIGSGLSFGIIALDSDFKRLTLESILSGYNKSSNRLLLLDYDGTLMPQNMIDTSPSDEVISLLNGLCNDPKNVVFIVTGRGKDTLTKWFSPCERLGLSAEHGCFTRWTKDSQWESCISALDLNWKQMALPVMKHYTEATDGSFIEQKESALVWHHGDAHSEFGSCQAMELLDHFENVLANEPVVATRGHNIIELKPPYVSKGVVVKNLFATMSNKGKVPDFVLCIGDDRSDEDMFESIATCMTDKAEAFTCSVGEKPSKAKYYLDDTNEVIQMLQGLVAA